MPKFSCRSTCEYTSGCHQLPHLQLGFFFIASLLPNSRPLFKQSGYSPEIQTWFQNLALLAAIKIFPLLCPELLAVFHHLCNHIYSSTGQGSNPPQKGKIQSHTIRSVVWCFCCPSVFYFYYQCHNKALSLLTLCMHNIVQPVLYAFLLKIKTQHQTIRRLVLTDKCSAGYIFIFNS